LLEQDFNFALCFFQFFTAGGGELNTFFKELQGLLEGDIAFLKLIHDLFQALKAIFKSGQCQTPKVILLPDSGGILDLFSHNREI